MHDAVHDRVGMNATAGRGASVGLLELGAEDRRRRAMAQPHQLEQYPAEQLVGPLEQSLVQREQAKGYFC